MTRGSHSKVWSAELGPGMQRTIYAPKLFFKLWPGDDSGLKRMINEYLMAYKPQVQLVTLDDI